MRYRYSACVVLLAVAAGPSPAQEAKSLTPITGEWDRADKWPEDELLVAYGYGSPPPPDNFDPSYTHHLIRGSADDTVAQAETGLVSRTDYRNPAVMMRNGTCKLTVAHGRVWIIAPGCDYFHVIPIEDFQNLESSHWGRRLWQQKPNKYGDERWGHDVRSLFFRPAPGEHVCNDEPLPKLKTFGAGLPFSPSQQQHLFASYHAIYDLIPLSARSATLVWLYNGRLCVQDLDIGKPLGGSKGLWGATPLPNAVKRSVKAPFDGGFWAYEVAGVYYLLTHKGKLYTATKSGRDGLDVRTVWDEKDRPLIGAIEDVTTGHVYAFGTDDVPKKGWRFTFAMSPKPDAVFYRAQEKPGDGFREAQDCVHAVKKYLHPDIAPAPAPRPVKP